MRLRQGAVVLSVLVGLVFAPGLLCGLYMDDYSFLQVARSEPGQVWDFFLHYVPGRNLQIPAFWALDRLTAGSLPALHAVFLLCDIAAALLVLFIVWEWTGMACVALPAALLFALMPHHGETHFWLTQFVQCQVPALLCLAAVWLALRRWAGLGRRLAASFAAYLLAFFMYDQAFFLWPLLLLVHWMRARPGERRLVIFAAMAGTWLSFNIGHVLLRHFSKMSYGGRPVIRWGDFWARVQHSLGEALRGLFAPPSPGKLSHWAWTVLLVAVSLTAGWLLVRLIRRWADSEKDVLDGFRLETGPLRLMLFGLAWLFLAYLPNYFWYMNPRHNLIPSFGWTLFCAGAVVWLTGRLPRLAAAVGGLAVLMFANAVTANVHEASEWAYGHRLHRAYLEEARRLGEVDNIFLLGAPRYVKKGAAFNLLHDVTLAAALDSNRTAEMRGDYQITPTARGGFYSNDLYVWGRDNFHWLPYDRMNAVAYLPGENFRCVRGLRLRDPEGGVRDRTLRPTPDCREIVSLDQDVALTSVLDRPSDGKTGRPVPGIPGLSLASAEVVAARPGLLRLSLEWATADRPGTDFAVLPTLLDGAGRVLYDAVHPSPTAGRKNPVVWPLYNDEKPASAWRPRRRIRENYVLRLSRPLSADAATLRLSVRKLRPGEPSQPAGELLLPLAEPPHA